MNFASNLLGKAVLKSKVNSMERSISEATTFEEEGSQNTSLFKGKNKVSREDRNHWKVKLNSEFQVSYSILQKERRWTELSRDAASGLLVENFARKTYPVTAYRCTGTVRTAATLEQLAEICFKLEDRRKWDLELTKESRTLEVLEPHQGVLEYEARGSSLGGLVAGRGYVDLRGKKVSGNKAEIYWGSTIWEQDFGDGLVRGWNYPQGCTWERVGTNEYVLRIICHRDVKGWLPYAAAENAMPGGITYSWNALANFAAKRFPIEK